ncbi:MAG: DUF2917 domain-containing protein [Noviherbaspirillum sp.]
MQARILAAAPGRIECELHENQPLRLVGAEGRRVQCLSGVVWITAYNQPADTFLKPGDVYVVPNGGLVLAEAIGHGHIRVDVPRILDCRPYRVRFLRTLKIAMSRRKLPVGSA